MPKKNPFVNKSAYSAANGNKRRGSTNPQQDAIKIEQLQQASKILKQAKAHYRKGMAIDSVKVISSKFKLGGIKKTAEFMNKMAGLPSSDIKVIKQIVANPKHIKNEQSKSSHELKMTPGSGLSSNHTKAKKTRRNHKAKKSNSTSKKSVSKKSTNNNENNDDQGFNWPS